METKFLSNGRKVCVIGKINAVEYIVQEIFVTEEGDEIPSGEKFTTKNIHDEPSKSYKEAEEERLQKRLDSLKYDIEKANFELNQAKDKIRINKKIIGSALASAKFFGDKEKTKTLKLFASGSIKYLVKDTYRIEPPIPFDDAVKGGAYDRDNIRLISLFGKSNGDIEYRINEYSDGSGSYCNITPFETYSQAINHIKKAILSRAEKNPITVDEFRSCLKMGINFTKAETSKIKRCLAETRNNSIKSLEENYANQILRVDKQYADLDL